MYVWRLLRKLRCSTNRITDIVKAVFTTPQREVGKTLVIKCLAPTAVPLVPNAVSRRWTTPGTRIAMAGFLTAEGRMGIGTVAPLRRWERTAGCPKRMD